MLEGRSRAQLLRAFARESGYEYEPALGLAVLRADGVVYAADLRYTYKTAGPGSPVDLAAAAGLESWLDFAPRPASGSPRVGDNEWALYRTWGATHGTGNWEDDSPPTLHEALRRLGTLTEKVQQRLPNLTSAEDRLWALANGNQPDDDHADPPAVEQLMVQYRGEDHPRMQRLYDLLMQAPPGFHESAPEFLDLLAECYPAPFVLRKRV